MCLGPDTVQGSKLSLYRVHLRLKFVYQSVSRAHFLINFSFPGLVLVVFLFFLRLKFSNLWLNFRNYSQIAIENFFVILSPVTTKQYNTAYNLVSVSLSYLWAKAILSRSFSYFRCDSVFPMILWLIPEVSFVSS